MAGKNPGIGFRTAAMLLLLLAANFAVDYHAGACIDSSIVDTAIGEQGQIIAAVIGLTIAVIGIAYAAGSVLHNANYTVIFWTRGGIASALISLPNRYMHSPVEVVSLK